MIKQIFSICSQKKYVEGIIWKGTNTLLVTLKYSSKYIFRVSKMVQWVNVLATKPYSLSLSSWTMWWNEKTDSQNNFWQNMNIQSTYDHIIKWLVLSKLVILSKQTKAEKSPHGYLIEDCPLGILLVARTLLLCCSHLPFPPKQG